MNTRLALGFAFVALLAVTAGCSAAGSISMQPVEDVELAEEASRQVPDDPDEDDVVRRAIENGTATVVDQRPPVTEELPFRHDGRFYAVNHTETGTEPGYEVSVRIDYNASSVEGTVVDYEDLPAVDRRLLAHAMERTDMPEERLEPGYDFGVGGTYSESDGEASAFVDNESVDAVRYDGEVYPVDASSESTTLSVYRYEATVVAESPEEYAGQLRENYEFELSGLSDAEREVVEGALNDTSYIEDDDNEGFASLVERFQNRPAVEETDYSGSFVVRYEGQLYWVEVDYGDYGEE